MLPEERELVARLKDKPFTLLGINSDESRSALTKIVADEKITWPNIYDGPAGEGPIAKQWNVFGWPTIYVLDQKGVIRHRDLQGKKLDEAVDKLLQESSPP